MPSPAVFLDRDGVIAIPEFREGRSFAVRRLEDFALYPGSADALERIGKAGFARIVVTNQPDVGAGRIAAETVEAMHRRMCEALPLEGVETCPHTRAEGCDCRKPAPGMLLRAAAAHDLDLARSWMIGDRSSDVEAGRAAGCRTIFIDHGYTAEMPPQKPDHTARSLPEAIEFLLAQTVMEMPNS